MKHPGTPNLYDTSKPVADGGLCFRARFGVKAPEKYAKNDAGGRQPAGRRELAGGLGDQGRLSRDHHAMLDKLGWAGI